MAVSIITNNQKAFLASQIIESVTEPANTTYYFFTADHTLNPDNTVMSVSDTVEDTYIDVYKNMIQGKRISSSDFAYVIENNQYVSNTAYDMYEHDVEYLDKNFYVSVDEGSYIHVYKCLDNNLNGRSTTQPNFSHITGANTIFYRTSDGYAWKYMYSFSSSDKLKFSTTKYIPVIANSSVQANAVAGAIDAIKIETVGRKYDNYIEGSWSGSDIRVGGNTVTYQISDDAKNSNSFYTGCLLYVSAGTGSGQYKLITDYFSNNSGKYVVVNSAFTTTPTNGTQYQIYPNVNVYGTGRESSNVVARALINASSSNSVYRVEILNRGAGYTFYATANVTANSVVGVQAESALKVILPPPGGHGANAITELLCNKLELSVKISNNESNTVSTKNGFRQVGIIQDPLFANVLLTTTNVSGIFTTTETVYKISPSLICSNVSVNTTSNALSVTLDTYRNNLKANDMIYLEGNSVVQLAYVNTVTNTTSIQISTNGYFTSNTAKLYFANPSTNAVVYFANSTAVAVTNCYGTISNSDVIVGYSSGSKATVNVISRSGITKNFNTFMNMFKVSGSLISGTFQENEAIRSGANGEGLATGLLHSYQSNGTFDLYITNLLGDINIGGNTVVGANSGAVATFVNKYDPELVFGSGKVLFLENLDRVTRSAKTSETFQIIFDF